jgi:NosR/NirI family nitrous oxide reductase transcriptional regulator
LLILPFALSKAENQRESALKLARVSGLLFFISALLVLPSLAFGIQRFPPPQFSSGHELPSTTQPGPRAGFYGYLDVVVLLAALSVASYLALKKRSRRGISILGIFSLAYFGFWRKGCVCSIGAIQNVTLALFDGSYTVPITVIAFFTLPLIFTLFFGRTFCASVCPLGAIQDVFLLQPAKVPSWLEHALGMFPYLYLGMAVLFAATGSAFIICEYDPFVAFFRRSGSLNMLVLGACFLVIGMFVGRPYCRYLCPYSVLLRLTSRASKWHLTITSDECIRCRLCEDACPFSAIQKPTQDRARRSRTDGKTRLAILLTLLPAFVASGILIGVRVGRPLSGVNATVSLAQQIWLEDGGKVKESTEASDAFRRTGRPTEELYQEALYLTRQFTIGGGLLGAFLGLAIGMKMIQLSVRRSRENYEINRATCVSCGRCISYCPVGRARPQKQKALVGRAASPLDTGNESS